MADTLHQLGRTAEAEYLFRESEQLQQQELKDSNFLYSMQGFQYCDLLLGQRGQVEEVKKRATKAIELAKENQVLLDIALQNLALGRAWLLDEQQEGTNALRKAKEFLHIAVQGLRQAGAMEFIARGLLTHAELNRFLREFESAERDLAEAYRIAKRSGMGLNLVDYHIQSTRLRRAQDNKTKAREHLAVAKELINRMGYHRRDKEVGELEAQLA